MKYDDKTKEQLIDEIKSLHQRIDELEKADNNLEFKVKERTKELVNCNIRLENDIGEIKRIGIALKESEEKFRALAENSPDIISRLDKELRYIYINHGSNTLGLSPENFIGKKLEEIAPSGEITKIWIENVRKVLKTGEIQEMEFEFPSIYGLKIFHSYMVPEYGANGEIESLLAVSRDISERKRAEEKFGKLANIVESSDDAIISLTFEGIITSWNRGAEVVYGYSAQEIIKKHVFILMGNSQWKILEKRIDKIRKGKRLVNYESKRIRKNGNKIIVSVSLSPIKDFEGKIKGISVISRDVSERKYLEESLHKTVEELKRSNEELQQFAYVASHDLQEPLRTIASFTQLLEMRYKGELGSDADEYIGFIVEGAKRMQQLISDLLAYSRISTMGEEFKPVKLGDILNDTFTNLNTLINENNALITHDQLPTVFGDSNQLLQLFQNLISNAIKFKKENELPKIHISTYLDEKNEKHVFKIIDNGIGIDPQFKERIFVIFQRLHTIDTYSGTGIGLSVCKRVVMRHGGDIWVESELDKGSAFYFTIPANIEN